jgi:hypothetical protein
MNCLIAKEYLEANGVQQRLADHISSLFIRAPVPAYEKEFMFPCCGTQKIIPKKASQANLLSLQKGSSHGHPSQDA